MSKTGYEIRADILALAKDYLDKQNALNMEYGKRMIEAGNVAISDIMKSIPQPYTVEDMIKAAERMYTFVDKKGEK